MRYKSFHVGKHRCPRPNIKGDFETSYKSQFKNTHIMVPSPPKPYVLPERHYDPNVLTSNYKEAFKSPPVTNELNSSRFENIGVIQFL